MFAPIALLPLCALGTFAQTTVQKVFFAAPSNNDAYAGSVVGVTSGLTTYALACTSGTFSCYTGSTIQVTDGPNSFEVSTLTVTDGATASVTETCTIAGTTSATCVAAVSVSLDGQSTAVTTTTTLGTADFNYHPVTIAAGAGKLSNAAATSASGNAAPMVTGMGLAGAAAMGIVAML